MRRGGGDFPGLHVRARGRRRARPSGRRAGAPDPAGRCRVDTYRDPLYAPRRALRHPDVRRQSLDARVYAWSQTRHATATPRSPRPCTTTPSTTPSPTGSRDRRLVGVMGGHALQRDDAGVRATPRGSGTRAGRRATSSPPAAAPARWRRPTWARYLAGQPTEAALDEALCAAGRGAVVPALRRRLAGRGAARSRERFPDGTRPLGIPTWHYGHEPTNVFATAIAKYFRNALREAILLAGLRGRDRVPARRRRHRPGGVPGRLRELLRRRVVGGADGAGRRGVLDRGRCPAWPLLRTLARGPADGEARAPRRHRRRGRGPDRAD